MRAQVLVLTMLVLAGCQQEAPKGWYRADGSVPAGAELELAQTYCRGEVEKAAIQGQSTSTINSSFGPDRHDLAAYQGCMAGRGLLLREIR